MRATSAGDARAPLQRTAAPRGSADVGPTTRPLLCRRRVNLLLAQRVALLAIVLVPGAHVITDAPPTTIWHTAGRLLMAVRSFPLLALPLGFQLSPLRTLLLQAASVALVGARVAPACAYQDLRAPVARKGMRA